MIHTDVDGPWPPPHYPLFRLEQGPAETRLLLSISLRGRNKARSLAPPGSVEPHLQQRHVRSDLPSLDAPASRPAYAVDGIPEIDAARTARNRPTPHMISRRTGAEDYPSLTRLAPTLETL